MEEKKEDCLCKELELELWDMAFLLDFFEDIDTCSSCAKIYDYIIGMDSIVIETDTCVWKFKIKH